MFLLLYINEKYIVATLRIYSNLMTLSVFFAIAAFLAVAAGAQPFGVVDFGGGRWGGVYLGSYYVLKTSLCGSICMPAPIFRIQGLCEEPGTYAFALLPAFFWLLIVDKSYVRTAVIVVGLMLTLSFGVGFFLLLLLPLMVKKHSTSCRVPAYILSAVCAIGLMYVVSGSCINRYLNDAVDLRAAALVGGCGPEGSLERQACIEDIKRSVSTSFSGKGHSFHDRTEGLLAVWRYLKVHVSGTGTALGMTRVNNSISVGYAVAVLESGIVGGFFYLTLFALMGWLALKTILFSKNESFDERIMMAVALSVCSVLAMGAQRIQPDLSLWHMWIYAMFFYLLQKTPALRLDANSV